jgi:hypothetical protein
MKTLRLEDIQLDPSLGRVTKPARKKPKARGHFLKGPIPTHWLIKANRAGGSSLAVGNILWHLCGLRQGEQTILLTTVECKKWGVSRESKRRALEALESAGLIAVERRGSKNPLVTILDGEPHD